MIRLWLTEHDDDLYHYKFQVEDDSAIGEVIFSKKRKAVKFVGDTILAYPDSYYGRINRSLFDMYRNGNFMKLKIIAWI
ncbi:hypothetical protein [Lactobacillus brevis] [Lactiplantibacillus mudanjiangensis]|uniref:hypothetical protein n=1 Tax=Lactiplantibacillus mudanjiangensis TaxID=1296538 RepID=UPI001014A296|nr:hypothetical protein [Lactiplantibacillus mudanjiangensis]VDG31258.1 hypothetical protein [Lactobacillus brevis] [Lactiplantibacillus mudanjiangensis]